jgi:hypothetical protein
MRRRSRHCPGCHQTQHVERTREWRNVNTRGGADHVDHAWTKSLSSSIKSVDPSANYLPSLVTACGSFHGRRTAVKHCDSSPASALPQHFADCVFDATLTCGRRFNLITQPQTPCCKPIILCTQLAFWLKGRSKSAAPSLLHGVATTNPIYLAITTPISTWL